MTCNMWTCSVILSYTRLLLPQTASSSGADTFYIWWIQTDEWDTCMSSMVNSVIYEGDFTLCFLSHFWLPFILLYYVHTVDWRCTICSAAQVKISFFKPYLLLGMWRVLSLWLLNLIFNSGAWLLHNKAGKQAIEYVNVEIGIQRNGSLDNTEHRDRARERRGGEHSGLSLHARISFLKHFHFSVFLQVACFQTFFPRPHCKSVFRQHLQNNRKRESVLRNLLLWHSDVKVVWDIPR